MATLFAKPLTRAHDPISRKWQLKSGAGRPIFFIDRIAVTPEVPTEGIVDVEVEAVNAALFISPFDDDKCAAGSEDGFEYRLTINPSWTSPKTETVCLGMVKNKQLSQFTFDAPTSGGTQAVEVTAEMTGSGNSATESYPVVVNAADDGTDSGDTRPGAGGGETGDEGGDDEGGDGSLDELFGQLFPELGVEAGVGIGLGAVLVFLILLVALQR